MHPVFGAILFLLLFFLPTIVAIYRGKGIYRARNERIVHGTWRAFVVLFPIDGTVTIGGIFLLNLFLGWTVIGWFVALFLAWDEIIGRDGWNR